MTDIKIFTTGGFWGGVLWRGEMFFFTFHQCNNTNITYQQIIFVYVDILRIVNIVMLRCVFPPNLKNSTLAAKNASSPTGFDL